MDNKELAKWLRDRADELDPVVSVVVNVPSTKAIPENPYADTFDTVQVVNDEYLEVSPRIVDRWSSSHYLRKVWSIAYRAGVKLILMRGAHPDGCFDFAYPKIENKLDRVAMQLIKEAFLELAVPHYPPAEAWWRDTSPADLRVGSDVWTKRELHISIDDTMHHRFDDKEYSHFHMDVREPV